MRSTNPSAEAAYRRALAKRGRKVRIIRLLGTAPSITQFSADVIGLVQDYIDDSAAVSRESGYSGRGLGAITQGKRQVIVMSQDLKEKHFPLPLQKNDQVALLDEHSNLLETLTVSQVDAEKRIMAGAIELMATGVE